MTNATLSQETQKHNSLLDRTVVFANMARTFVSSVPKTIASMGDCRRAVRSSGEIGAAYISADSATDRDEFAQYVRTCQREARQSRHWLRLLDVNLDELSKEIHDDLVQEATELETIFGAIIAKTEK